MISDDGRLGPRTLNGHKQKSTVCLHAFFWNRSTSSSQATSHWQLELNVLQLNVVHAVRWHRAAKKRKKKLVQAPRNTVLIPKRGGAARRHCYIHSTNRLLVSATHNTKGRCVWHNATQYESIVGGGRSNSIDASCWVGGNNWISTVCFFTQADKTEADVLWFVCSNRVQRKAAAIAESVDWSACD